MECTEQSPASQKPPPVPRRRHPPIRKNHLFALLYRCCDWFIAEYDSDDLFWGYVNLNDEQNAEWGYVSFSELKSLNIKGIEIDCDQYWKVRPADHKMLLAHEPSSTNENKECSSKLAKEN